MSVIAYIRVSTEQQAAEGVSLAAQASRIQAWAESVGHAVAHVFEDAGISGSRMDTRPGLLSALAAMEQGDILVVYSLSRLARSTRDTLSIADRLEKAGADLVSLTERIDTTGAAGRMLFRLLAVLTEFERELISERTTTSLRHKREHMLVYGHVPFGYRRAGERLEVDQTEQDVLREIMSRRGAGHSWHGLARWLNEQGVPTKQGGKWYAATVRGVVMRPAVGRPECVAG